MTVRHSTGQRNLVADAIGTAFDGGTGRINVYTGAQPASSNDAATGTLLGTLTLASDAFAVATGGAVSINAVTGDTSADASGTAGYIRFYRSTDTAPGSAAVAGDRRLDLAVGTDVTFDSANIVAGGTIGMSSFTYNAPA